MSGHSKWANIKRKKSANDAEKGKIFTKIAKEMQVAVKQGGADPEGNFRLKLCIQKAKANNMPADNIKRCIEKAAGAGEGDNYEEFYYEGYGAGGVAILCAMMTENRNRSASEIRYIFSRNHGNLGETGCVNWMFERKGEIVVAGNFDEDELMMLALEHGADDLSIQEDSAVIITASGNLETLRAALLDGGYAVVGAEIMMLPGNTIEITDVETAANLMTLIEKLEDNDDVQEVFANYEIPDEIMEQL
ncbi:MAG: YebC/PmpR family DNA-binding transcriptional regulator [Clostridiales bacterium]